jgi:probable HAF family extracellular repeat protein
MTSPDNVGTRCIALAVVAAAVVLAMLAVMGSRAADARAVKPDPAVGPAGLRALELGLRGEHKTRPPAAVSNASLLLDKGVFRPLPDVPGSLLTTHTRNNNRGQTVGAYVDSLNPDGVAAGIRGFLMRGGRVTRIDVPGALLTLPLGLNDRGQVVGNWVGQDATVNPVTGETGPTHGFLWEKGRYTKFDVPGATATSPYEINNRGQIVGNYNDRDGAQHGFVLRNGRVTTIDHPRAAQAENLTGTRVNGIDDRGRLVGAWGDENGQIHAWRWENGRFTDLEPPGGLQVAANQINNRGQILGVYLDGRPKLVSFLYERGRYRRIEAPGRCDTAAVGINDRGRILIAAAGTTDGSTCPPQGSDQ